MAHKPQRILLDDAQVVGIITELQVLAAGVHEYDVEVHGNAALSTVYLKAANGATILVEWLDFNPLATSSDLNPVDAHPPITTVGYHRRFISKLHQGTSRVKLTITGGNPEMGVFATAIQVTGTYPIDGGVQAVQDESESGTPGVMRAAASAVTTPAGTTLLATGTVPSGKAWRLQRLEAQCRAMGFFSVWVDAVRIAKSNTDALHQNPAFQFDPYDTAAAGQVVEVRYTQSHGTQAFDVSAFLFRTEIDA